MDILRPEYRLIPGKSYLRDSEQLLGDLNNTGHLLDVVDARLDSAGVVGTGGVQDILVLLDLTLSPPTVSGTTVLGHSGEDGKQTEGGDSLLVHHVELVADGGDGDTGGSGQSGGLGNQRVTGDRIEDRLGLLCGLLGGDVGGRASRGQGSDGRDTDGDSRPQTGGA